MTKTISIDELKAQFAKDPEKVVLFSIGGVSLIAMFFLGSLISSGIFLGICTALSMLLLLFKTKAMRPRIWNTVVKHPLLTDALLSFSILGFAATGVTGLIAGVTGALFTSAAIKYAVEVMGPAIDPETNEAYLPYEIPFLRKKENTDEQSINERDDQNNIENETN